MYKKILVPIDISHESSWRKAIPVAVELATRFGSGLMIMTVVRDIDAGLMSYYPPACQWLHDNATEQLKTIAGQWVPETLKPTLIVGDGSVSREITRAAREHGIDLIVMASHRPEMKDYLIGPNATTVVRHASCSVLIVRE